MTGAPLVSVILIGYNDAARISRALDSLRRQTLHSIEIIVVDDASTDGMPEIVESIAARDPRVRLLRREENSGGCSAPRNDGMKAATAPWVMFCDSDDEYEAHACANLLDAAEKWDADVVCGMAVRHDVRKGTDRPWRPELHDRDRVVDSLEAEPQLLYDTISVNKIYRRSMLIEELIEFPPGLLFEDQVFTLRCFHAARRIGILQACVYIWNVDRSSEEISITQGRMQRRNVIDRVEINRLMDAILAESSENLRLAKAVKFLRHEGYLYLWAIAENRDQRAALQTAEVFRSYVSGVDPRAFAGVRPALRVALFGLLSGDLDLLRRAMRWERWASVVDTQVVADGSRQYWTHPVDRAIDQRVLGLPDSWWLDVTSLRLLDMPFSTRRYFHELIDLRVDRSRVSVSIRTTDFAGDAQGSIAHPIDAQMVWVDKQGAVIVSLPLTRGSVDPQGRITWLGAGRPSVHIDRPLMKPDRGSVAVRLARGGNVNTTAVRTVDVPVDKVFVPLPAIAFADRPAGVTFLAGERASVAWRPGGRSRGPVAWGRRASHAARRRIDAGGRSPRGVLLPGAFDVPKDRPIVAYVPAPSAAGTRNWPLDLSQWDDRMSDVCYLLACGDIAESIPTRLWGSIQDARSEPLGRILEHADLVVTDDPALIDVVGRSIVFRPDDGAGRYLLPVLPSGYPVAATMDDLVDSVRTALGVIS
ncbi:MAG: glycosyltransferase family 2 protein [Candidatus Nanopelagicales bacterium]